MLENFPTYKRTLASFERAVLQVNMGKGKRGCGYCYGNEDQVKKFNEEFNHKPFDELGIPRVVDQPVDFTI